MINVQIFPYAEKNVDTKMFSKWTIKLPEQKSCSTAEGEWKPSHELVKHWSISWLVLAELSGSLERLHGSVENRASGRNYGKLQLGYCPNRDTVSRRTNRPGRENSARSGTPTCNSRDFIPSVIFNGLFMADVALLFSEWRRDTRRAWNSPSRTKLPIVYSCYCIFFNGYCG